MANLEHVAKLKEGVEAWNSWRKQEQEVDADLKNAKLRSQKPRDSGAVEKLTLSLLC